VTVARSRVALAQLAVQSFRLNLLHLFPVPMGTAEVSGNRDDLAFWFGRSRAFSARCVVATETRRSAYQEWITKNLVCTKSSGTPKPKCQIS